MTVQQSVYSRIKQAIRQQVVARASHEYLLTALWPENKSRRVLKWVQEDQGLSFLPLRKIHPGENGYVLPGQADH